jgi:hypothetical protein
MMSTITPEVEAAELRRNLPLLQSRALAERALRAADRDVAPFESAIVAAAESEARIAALDRTAKELVEDQAFIAAYDQAIILVRDIPRLKAEWDAAKVALETSDSFDYQEMLRLENSWSHPGASLAAFWPNYSQARKDQVTAFLAARQRDREARVRYLEQDDRFKSFVARFPALAALETEIADV